MNNIIGGDFINIKALLIAGFLCMSIALSNQNQRYQLSAVYESNNELTTFITPDGNLWSVWTNSKSYVSGKSYLLEFDTCGTHAPEDDILCSIIGVAEISSYIEENGERIYDTIDSPYTWEIEY